MSTPTVSWPNLPENSNHIAMDANGEWFSFRDKPILPPHSKKWLATANRIGAVTRLTRSQRPENFNGDWRQSLISKP